VHRRLWRDVPERKSELVFVHDIRRNLLGDDLVEDGAVKRRRGDTKRTEESSEAPLSSTAVQHHQLVRTYVAGTSLSAILRCQSTRKVDKDPDLPAKTALK